MDKEIDAAYKLMTEGFEEPDMIVKVIPEGLLFITHRKRWLEDAQGQVIRELSVEEAKRLFVRKRQ